AGVAHDSWSSKIRSVTQIMPPEKTSCDMIDTTSIGMIWSCDWASADRAMQRIAAATQVAATVTNSSKPTLPKSTASVGGEPQPMIVMIVAIADWMIANPQNTAILAPI